MTPTSTEPDQSSPDTATWHSVHVCYHDPLDDLILDPARPLFGRLHPAVVPQDEPAETARRQRLAQLEWEPGPLSPWRPNNSVHVKPYDPRLHALGGQVSADLLAVFAEFMATHPNAADPQRSGRCDHATTSR